MPVLIQNIEYYDNFGNGPFPSYRNNAGDRTNVHIRLWSSIRISSLGNPLILDPSLNTILSTTLSWLDEGFRVGDAVNCYIYSSGGSLVTSWATAILYVDDSIIDLGSIPSWPNSTNGEFISIQAPSQAGRGDLEVLINHVKNSVQGSEFSLIDGEVSRLLFTDTSQLIVGANMSGLMTGNQSGQFLIGGNITRIVNPSVNEVGFMLIISFSNSGIYDADWFASADCLKPFLKFKWTRETGESSNPFVKSHSSLANTGWFNEPRNTDIIDSNLIQGITEIDYCSVSNHTIIVNGAVANIGLGASYIPLDETYYKNKLQNQRDLALFSPTTSVGVTPHNSAVNPVLASWQIVINSVVVVGTVTTINFTFTPNAAMNTFMAGREIGDRLFRLWVKCGNINHLAFNDQLTCEPPIGAPLEIEGEKAFFDHSENITEEIDFNEMLEFNTEDDLAYFGYFMLEKGKTYDLFTAKIEGYNSILNDDFTLLELNFAFSGVQISTDGRYLLNESVNVVNTLPTNSVKKDGRFYLYPSVDTATHYGVAVYLPVLFRWEYWLQQTNASNDFYPNQNKNWQQYDGSLGWEVRLELNLQEGGLSHLYSKNMYIKPYDSDAQIVQTIELFLDSTNQNVGIVVEGQLMRVVATHTLTNGNAWSVGTWGMITIEPKENAPRHILSTVLPYDNNTQNPLTPLTGAIMIITYPLPNVARMECYFDPNLVNLSNGCKFTTKIKGCTEDFVIFKTMTDGTSKMTTTNILKTFTT